MLVLLCTFNYINHCESGQGCSITNFDVCLDDGPNPVHPAHNEVCGSDDVTPHCGLQWCTGQDISDTV